jgi:hypothetical protein
MLDRSSIEAPESGLRVKLKRLDADSEWDKVLELTEAAMLRPCGRYWLDLQRYSVNAIEQKGYSGIARVVNMQLRYSWKPCRTSWTLPSPTTHRRQSGNQGLDRQLRDAPAIYGRRAAGRCEQRVRAIPRATHRAIFRSTCASTDDTASLDGPRPELLRCPPEIPETAAEPEPFTRWRKILPSGGRTAAAFRHIRRVRHGAQAVRDGRTAEGLGMITSILATERSGRRVSAAARNWRTC